MRPLNVYIVLYRYDTSYGTITKCLIGYELCDQSHNS